MIYHLNRKFDINILIKKDAPNIHANLTHKIKR
jgi:hypothetical protein